MVPLQRTWKATLAITSQFSSHVYLEFSYEKTTRALISPHTPLPLDLTPLSCIGLPYDLHEMAEQYYEPSTPYREAPGHHSWDYTIRLIIQFTVFRLLENNLSTKNYGLRDL